MLFAKLAWDKTTAFVLMNEILLTKLKYIADKCAELMMHNEADDILMQLESTYHGNLELLDEITEKLQEQDRSQASSASSLPYEEDHANKILDILDQIYIKKDTDTN